VRSAVVVIVVRDASTDQRFVECVCMSLWDICLCRGPSRTPVHHVRCYVPPSRSWSFGFKLSLRSLAFRVCVRARAAADAAVGLSKSCFHVPLCSTLLLLGRCRARTHSSSAPSGFFSASCVETLARHTSMGERRVGWSQFTLIVIVCWDPRAFFGLVPSRGSSPALQHGCAVPCCHPLFIPVVV
jgi:hypothetical protein